MLRLQERTSIHFILLTLFVLDLVQISYSARIPLCNKKREYKFKCNRCWCLQDETFVCTKMICNKIPQKFWKQAKVVTRQRAFALALLAMLTVVKFIKAIKATAPLVAAAHRATQQNPSESPKPEIKITLENRNKCL